MSETAKRGRLGEDIIAAYLTQRGYQVVAQNFHSRFGEIDLIVQNDRYIAFVEVKARKSSRFAAAREAVTPAKQQRIAQTAMAFLEGHPTDLQPRFDVAEVYLSSDGRHKIDYYDNAF